MDAVVHRLVIHHQHLDNALSRLSSEGLDDAERKAAQDSVNPKFVPRQHLLQYAVEGAEAGDPSELNALMRVGVGVNGCIWDGARPQTHAWAVVWLVQAILI